MIQAPITDGYKVSRPVFAAMNTVIFVVGAMWVLPIIALLLANLVLSMDQRRTLTAFAGDRAVGDDASARSIVRTVTRLQHRAQFGVPQAVEPAGDVDSFEQFVHPSLADIACKGMSSAQPLKFQISLN
jgi:hypothetical protein